MVNLLAFGLGATAIVGLGPMEMVIVGVVVLLLFGSRLPKVMRSLGQGITEFKKGVSGIDEEIEEAARKPSSTTKSES